jgi:type I restriction enzyme S subunit
VMASDLALAGTVVERPRIEAPWSLPPGWVWVDVGKFGKLIRGVNFTKDKVSPFLQNGYCSLLRGNNIQNGKVDETELTNVDSACVSDEQILRPGDIVLTMSSGSTALIGKSAWIGPRHSRMTFGAFCACLRANNEEDARWLFWFLQTQYYRRRIANAAKGTNINNLKREHLENLPIPLAPHAERRRVIAQVDKMFAEIAEGEAALAMARKGLSNFRRGLLKVRCHRRTDEGLARGQPR